VAYLGFNLRLSDGVSTVYLGTAASLPAGLSGCQLLTYPLVEPAETLKVATGDADGADVIGVRREDVNEAATVAIGVTFADAQQILTLINRLLRQAEERQEHGRGLPVFVELDPLGDGNYWRSEILAGRAVLDGATLGGYWKTRGVLQVVVRWLRRPYWEGAELELGLGNAISGVVAYARGGVALANHCDAVGSADGGHANWFEVDPESLAGCDLQAPIRLGLQVTDSVADIQRVIVVGGLLATDSSWAGLVGPFIEGESSADGTAVTTGATTGWSAGGYRSFGAPGVTEARVASWTLPAAWVTGGGREFVRVVARVVGAVPVGARVRLKLSSTAGLLWSGPEVILEGAHELQDLGVLQLPPGNLTATGDLVLDLWGRWATGTFGVDFLGFLPLASYRRYLPASVSVGIGHDEWLVDDGLAGQVYVLSGTDMIPGYVARGGQLLVYPHSFRMNRFWVLVEDSAGVALASRALRVQAWYRARRASL
jgi:hypothetical protein